MTSGRSGPPAGESRASTSRRRLEDLTPWLWPAVLIAIGCFLLFGSEIRARLDDDVFKMTYQFLLLVVIGGGVTGVYGRLDRRRDKRDRERETVRVVRTELANAYNQAKCIRRVLRARAIAVSPDGDTVLGAVYDKQMQLLNDAQLAFEDMIRDVSDGTTVSGDALRTLTAEMETGEKYLHDVIAGWERLYRTFEGEPKHKPLAHLPELSAFIATSSDPFFTRFQQPARRVLATLNQQIAASN